MNFAPHRLGAFALIGASLLTSDSLRAGYNFNTIIDSNSGFSPSFSALGQRKVNDSGKVAFLAEPEFAQHRIYRSSGGGVHTHIAGPPNYFGLSSTGNGAISETGHVTFVGSRESFQNGIYRGNGASISTIRQSSNASHLAGPQRAFLDVSVSGSGQIAFRASRWTCGGEPVTCGPPTHGTHAIIDGSEIAIAETGATWSDVSPYAPVINDAGQVLFAMSSAFDGNTHLLRYSAGSIAPIDVSFVGGNGYWMNGLGDVVTAEPFAITLVSNGVSTTVVSTDDGFDSLMKVGTGEAFINDSGQVAFWGSVSSFGGNPVQWQGVYTGPDVINNRVLVSGDTLLGRSVGAIELLGLNNSGQMLLNVSEQGGSWQALVIATPKLDGDFNDDGSVDAADYVVWRKGLGTTRLPEEYGIWRANFGRTAGAGSSGSHAAPVPGPASSTIVVLALSTVLSTVHRGG
jgi:hypothetical protein